MYCGKFKDVFPFIKNGANIKQDANAGGIPITRIETLAGGEFNTSRLGYANIFDISPYYEYVLNSGDILMSHINSPEYLGRAVVFEDKYNIVIHGMNLLRLKANKEFIDSRYAVYLFNGNTFKEHIRKITKKSVNQASFSINDLKEIELQLPSIENQVIAAEKLDKLKMLIKKKNRLILFLDEMIKSRFVEMFGDPNASRTKYKLVPIHMVTDCMVPGRDKPKSFTGEIPWITINDLNINGYTNKSKLGLGLTIDEVKEVNRKCVPQGSVLMSCVGNLGLCSIASVDVVINQQLHSYQCNEFINNLYLMYYLSFKNTYMNKIASSTTVLYMNKNACNNIPVLLPPIELQISFAKYLNQINKLKSDVQKSIDETQLLMDSLMQEYFG
ncbi:restriction endonuclease subunit S [uncultured Veillonella sp.]|uniref:restriction endonuclease subunit S n=1 Tax=uncultured Veillonella sp. TaxID=159268 RepID=UPI0028D4CC32|nr:restriction endonuclease subunit S [uncultured Veillonella sp.]